MNVLFSWCCIKVFVIISKLLDAEKKLKLTYYLFKRFSIKLYYVMVLKYMYIFS